MEWCAQLLFGCVVLRTVAAAESLFVVAVAVINYPPPRRPAPKSDSKFVHHVCVLSCMS